MTLSIERASFIGLAVKNCQLVDEKIVLLESIVDNYYTSIDKNHLANKSNIFIDVVVFGVLLWICPDTDMNQIEKFVSLLYNDETRVNRNIDAIKRLPDFLVQKYKSTDNIKLVKDSLVLKLIGDD